MKVPKIGDVPVGSPPNRSVSQGGAPIVLATYEGIAGIAKILLDTRVNTTVNLLDTKVDLDQLKKNVISFSHTTVGLLCFLLATDTLH